MEKLLKLKIILLVYKLLSFLVIYMSKKDLIKNLEKDIYCRIQPSTKHGVGVFAIKDIPKWTNPYKTTYGPCSVSRYININSEDLKNVPKGVIKILDDFIGLDEVNKYSIPIKGLNTLDISFYMNHDKNNNINIINDPKCEFTIFKTNKLIKKGEELLINYDEF